MSDSTDSPNGRGATAAALPPATLASAAQAPPDAGSAGSAPATDVAAAERRSAERPRHGHGAGLGIDGISTFLGIRWEDPQTVRLRIRPELINAGGMLSGVVTYGMVDYCMGSTLWAQSTEQERIATIGISINYIQTALRGEIVCRTELDRRNRSTAVMHSEVRDEEGRLLVTAIGSYAIFIPRSARADADAGPDRDG